MKLSNENENGPPNAPAKLMYLRQTDGRTGGQPAVKLLPLVVAGWYKSPDMTTPN